MHPYTSQIEFNNQYQFEGIQNNQNRLHSKPSTSNIQTGKSSSGRSVRVETSQLLDTRTSNNVSSVTWLPLPSREFFSCNMDGSINSNRNVDTLPNAEGSNQSTSLNIPLENSVTQAFNPNQNPEKLEAADASLDSVKDKAITFLLNNYITIPNQPDKNNTCNTPKAINLNSKSVKSISSKKRTHIKIFNKNNEFHLDNPKKKLKFKVPIEEQHVVAELMHSDKLVVAIKSDTPEVGSLLDAIDTEKSSFGTLLQSELSLNKNLIVGESYMNPLLLAVNNNSTNTVKLFLNRKINIPNNQLLHDQLIQGAIYNYNSEILELLMEYGVTVKAACSDDNPFLIIAFLIDNKEAVKILIKYGVDINFSNKKGITALMLAVQRGDLEWTQLLIDNNADKNFSSKNDLKSNIEKLKKELVDIPIDSVLLSKTIIRLGQLKKIEDLID